MFVACVKHGELYDWTWVDKLYRGVQRSFSQNVTFCVFTDKFNSNAPYQQYQLPHFEDLAGRNRSNAAWWYKLFLFSEQNPIKEQLIYFDLDVVLVGDCSFLCEVPNNQIGMCREWNDLVMGNSFSPVEKYNSSVMVFNPTHHRYVWNRYMSNRKFTQQQYFGDQNYISHAVPKDLFYELDSKTKILSWKYQVYHGGVNLDNPLAKHNISQYNTPGVSDLPDGARIVLFSGNENWKPSSALDVEFVKEFWS